MAVNVQNPTPLYLQIVDDIRSKIASAALKAGDQLGSQAELASAYGVSLITVKKALATLTHQGFVFSRVGKGTYVSQSSLEPDLHGAQTIGLVLQDIRSPYFSRMVGSIEDAAYERGYHVLLSSSSGRVGKEEELIARFRRFGVSGMIIASMTHKYHATPTIRKLLQGKFPFVMVSYIADEDVPCVGSDHVLGGHLATEYLIKLGYQRIGYINGERGNQVGDLRGQGYEEALKAHGRKLDKRLIFHLGKKGEWHDYQSGYEIGKRFQKLEVKPDALFVYNDLSALGFEDAILSQGLKIPDDVALIGFDDIERGEYATVPLTTIRQPMDLIGTQAMDLLLKLMEGKKGGPIRRTLKPELIIRQSCGNGKGQNGNRPKEHRSGSTEKVGQRVA